VALRQLIGRLLRWRVRWQWYVLVILGPAAFSLAVAGVYALFGGSWSAAVSRAFVAPVVLLPLLLLILVATDDLGEELAWRGFALPRLLARHSALAASLILGIFWALWHLPLLWTSGIEEQQLPWWLLLLDVPAKSVLFTWVFLHTRGSVLFAVLFHASTNLFTVSPAVSVTGHLTFPVLATGAKWLLIMLLIALARSRLARRADPDALPQGPEAPSVVRDPEARVPRRSDTWSHHSRRTALDLTGSGRARSGWPVDGSQAAAADNRSTAGKARPSWVPAFADQVRGHDFA
jgi:membrane protease YdiL (CAAX protease family)